MPAQLAPFVVLEDSLGKDLSRSGVPYVRAKCEQDTNPKSIWLAKHASALHTVMDCFHRQVWGSALVILEPSSAFISPFLAAHFRTIIEPTSTRTLLPFGEMIEVLQNPNKSDLFIGLAVSDDLKVVVLYRGDGSSITVPKSWFRPSANGIEPDFNDAEIIDWGNTVRFGRYEAASDAILYDLDSSFRRHARKRELAQDTSFGACLRRLRLIRGLTQTDFEPKVTAREIRRIEQGEVASVRPDTLKAIADRLNVKIDEIGTY